MRDTTDRETRIADAVQAWRDDHPGAAAALHRLDDDERIRLRVGIAARDPRRADAGGRPGGVVSTLTDAQAAMLDATPQPPLASHVDDMCLCRADGCDAPCGNRAAEPCRTCLRPTCALCLIPLDGRCIDCWADVDRTGEPHYGGPWAAS